MKVLGFIPARSGSKGVPGKNVKRLAGRPLMAYTIKSALDALKSNILAEVVVSTDCLEYLRLAQSLGINNDYMRPAHLGSDLSPTIDAVRHILEWFGEKSIKFDAVMILQPTSPFRLPGHIEEAIKLMKGDPEATCVASVAKLGDHHPYRIKKD